MHIRAGHHVLAQIAVLADHGVFQDMGKMPDPGVFADGDVFIHFGGGMNKIIVNWGEAYRKVLSFKSMNNGV